MNRPMTTQQLKLFEGIAASNAVVAPAGITGIALGRQRLQFVIERGKARGSRVVEYVKELLPKDYIVRGSALSFFHAPADQGHSGIALRFTDPTTQEPVESVLHRHALRQACSVLGMPVKWADKLWALKDTQSSPVFYGRNILLNDLSELFRRVHARFLLRGVNDVTRGFLSDTYKRLDSAPLVDSFASACAEVGAVPCEGYVSDTKVGLQAILPQVYEPVAGEYMAYGVTFENSDFGNGAMSVSVFILRLVSMTGVIGNTGLRKIHLGKRLQEDIAWSERTRAKDIELAQEQVRDLVRQELSAERIEASQRAIQEAATTQLGGKDGIISLLKKFLTKGEIEKVLERYNSPDVEALPPGNNLWRLSSAVAWLAGQQADDEKNLELQHAAGHLLPGLAKS